VPEAYCELSGLCGLNTAKLHESAFAHRLKQFDAPVLATQSLKQSAGSGYPQTDATAEGVAVAAQAPESVVVGLPPVHTG